MSVPAAAVVVVPVSARVRAIVRFQKLWPTAVIVFGLILSVIWTLVLGYCASWGVIWALSALMS
jgi:hypothetical protein